MPFLIYHPTPFPFVCSHWLVSPASPLLTQPYPLRSCPLIIPGNPTSGPLLQSRLSAWKALTLVTHLAHSLISFISFRSLFKLHPFNEVSPGHPILYWDLSSISVPHPLAFLVFRNQLCHFFVAYNIYTLNCIVFILYHSVSLASPVRM